MLNDEAGSVCIVYKDKDGCLESFKDHALGIIECMENRWEYRGLKKRLSRLLSVDEEITECYLRLAALLHDIGKALDSEQSVCRQNECKSFPCHYFISSLFTVRLIEDLFRDDSISDYLRHILTSTDLKDVIRDYTNKGDVEKYLALTLVLLPIFLHHYAGITEESIDRCVGRVPRSIRLDRLCIEDILSVLSTIEKRCSRGPLGTVLTKMRDLIGRDALIPLGIFIFDHNVLYNTSVSFTKGVVEAAVGLLNLCDGIVANKNRRCNKTG